MIPDVMLAAVFLVVGGMVLLVTLANRVNSNAAPHTMLVGFAVFQVTCGILHLVSAVVVRFPHLLGGANLESFSAAASLATAFTLPALVLGILRPQVQPPPSPPAVPPATAVVPHPARTPHVITVRARHRRVWNRAAPRPPAREHLAHLPPAHTARFNNLLRMMTHELKTPLTVIQLQVRLLERNAASPVNPQVLGGLTRSTQRLQDLMDTLLEYARIESGRFQPNAQPFSLNDLAAQVLLEAQARGAQKGVTLVAEPGDDVPQFHNDPRVVRLILVNLVAYALTTTDSGHITVRVYTSGGFHCFSVTDSAPAVVPQPTLVLPSLLEQQDVFSSAGVGSGLGLAMVHQMVRALGGELQAEPGTGNGTTFTVRLLT